ncbi:MAG: NUDIX hydrolase [Peptoniphilaceae bacterium]
MAEYWDIYNVKGKKKNKIVRKGDFLKKGDYHLVVEGWIRNSQGYFLIQKRSGNKKLFPNKWYCSLGGSVQARENPKEGLIREAKEELGIDISNNKIRLKRIIVDKFIIFYIYLIDRNFKIENLDIQEEEVADAKIANLEEIERMIDEDEMISLDYYHKFFKSIEKIPFIG